MCPKTPPSTSPGSGWIKYGGNSDHFHCGFEGYLEDRWPTPDNPIAECFYDKDEKLVDDDHPYSLCGGTADQYRVDKGWWKSGDLQKYKDAWNHTWNDSGGIYEKGCPAWKESRRYEGDELDKYHKKNCRLTSRGWRC